MPKAVILLSGGLDSVTLLAMAMEQGFECYALSLDYGQRHRAELVAAKDIAAAMGATQHKVIHIGLDDMGGSALTDATIDVPRHSRDSFASTYATIDVPRHSRDSFASTDATIDVPRHSRDSSALTDATIDVSRHSRGGSALTDATIDVPRHSRGGIPVTYVPARNTVFLSLALGWAEVLGARDLFIGVNAVDYSGYPDCRPDYIEAFKTLAQLATKAGVEGGHFEIHTPLIELSKAEIIHEGTRLKVNYAATVSCYQADEQGRACGECDACKLRADGFKTAGIPDPTRYQN